MATHDPRRRAVLRGALAAGCAVALPAICTTGCDSDGGDAAGESPGAETMPDTDAGRVHRDELLISKTEAKYQYRPKGDQQCGNCAHFVPESNTCEVVEGNIVPNGWCMRWSREIVD